MAEAKLSSEAVGAAEGFDREGGQVINVLRRARAEEWLQ